MKKTYTRITVLICALITFVMLLGCALFTYVKVSDINDTYIDRYSNLRELAANYNANADLGVALLCTYSTWETYYSMTESNVGYYSEFMWKDMASSNVYVIPREDFICIYYNSEFTGSGENFARILKPDDDFTYGKEEHLWNVVLDAKTDDIFVYDGTVSYHRSGVGDRTVTCNGPEDLPYTIGELKDDWGEGKELYAAYVLSPKEYDLLLYFIENKEQILSRDQILDAVWGDDYEGYDRAVDTYVKKLRASLGKASYHIETVIKSGYIWKNKG